MTTPEMIIAGLTLFILWTGTTAGVCLWLSAKFEVQNVLRDEKLTHIWDELNNIGLRLQKIEIAVGLEVVPQLGHYDFGKSARK